MTLFWASGRMAAWQPAGRPRSNLLLAPMLLLLLFPMLHRAVPPAFRTIWSWPFILLYVAAISTIHLFYLIATSRCVWERRVNEKIDWGQGKGFISSGFLAESSGELLSPRVYAILFLLIYICPLYALYILFYCSSLIEKLLILILWSWSGFVLAS